MRVGYSDACLRHDPGQRHPESADRLRAIREALARRHGVSYHEAEAASRALLAAVHEEAYLEEVERFVRDGGGQWDPDTIAVEGTWEAATTAAGLASWAATEALAGARGRDTPFALGRPPGHHATADDAMGFCFLNNVAAGAASALGRGDAEPAVTAERVAILDWDVHHGNGTQDIFEASGDVLFASIHQAGLYPGTGDAEETGRGDGAGTTLNVPLAPGAGDAEYCHVLDELVAPALSAFDPDLLLVSAGFDAHRHDPISRMHVSTNGYGALTARLRDATSATDAAIAFVLEGGYSLEALAEGVATVHETFDGEVPVEPDDDPEEEVLEQVADIRSSHPLFQ